VLLQLCQHLGEHKHDAGHRSAIVVGLAGQVQTHAGPVTGSGILPCWHTSGRQEAAPVSPPVQEPAPFVGGASVLRCAPACARRLRRQTEAEHRRAALRSFAAMFFAMMRRRRLIDVVPLDPAAWPVRPRPV